MNVWLKKIIKSVLGAFFVVSLIDLFAYIFIYYFWWHININSSSVRYLLSSISQSLAAIFALVFIVVSVIIAYVSKNIVVDVLRYIFQKRGGIFVVSIFFFTLLNNFIFLGSILGGNTLLSINDFWIKTGMFSNILLFGFCFIGLIVYVYRSINISISPFYPFLKEVKKSIVPGLRDLVPFLNNRLNSENLVDKKIISFIPWKSEYMDSVKHKGRSGYVHSVDCRKVRSAYEYLNDSDKENGNKSPIFCLIEHGQIVEKGQDAFQFGKVDKKVSQKIKKLLSKSISTQAMKPRWLQGLNYLEALFRIAEAQVLNRKVMEEYIVKLGDIGEMYLSNRKKYLGYYDEKLKDFKYKELMDYWFAELYELTKKACVTKHELEVQRRILSPEDKPDIYPQSCLHRVAQNAYKFDETIYFEEALRLLWDYVHFSSSSDKSEIPLELLTQLNPVLEAVSSLSVYELKEKMDFEKLEKYSGTIIQKFLIVLKDYPSENATRTSYRKYNRLKRYLIDNIKNDLIGMNDQDKVNGYTKNAINNLLAVLYVLLALRFSEIHPGCANEAIVSFDRFLSKFIMELKNSRSYYPTPVPASVFIEPIMEKALGYIDFTWLIPATPFDDLIEEPESRSGGEVKSREYCLYVFFLILCFSSSSFCLSKDYWFPNFVAELGIKFDEFEKSVSEPNSPVNLILHEHFKRNQVEIQKAVQSVKDTLESFVKYSK